MTNRIAHLPSVFRQVIGHLCREPGIHPRHLPIKLRHRSLHKTGELVDFTPRELSPGRFHMTSSMVGPCTIAAVARFSPSGLIEKASVGHFSPITVDRDISFMLRESDPQRTVIFMAGMSQRSSIHSLRHSCENLHDRFARTGLPVQLSWQMRDLPEFCRFDKYPAQVISDIGLGVLGEGKEQDMVRRYILVGLTDEEICLFSIKHHYRLGAESRAVRLSVFSAREGRIIFPLD